MVRTSPRPGSTLPGAQEIRFSRTQDGVRIAHARHGSGPPLVVVACWLSHLQHDWQSPVWRHFLEELGSFTTLIRYDLRGHGLSDWAVEDFSLDALLSDLDAVIEGEGLERFALMGMSGYSFVALAYAARHPERVSRLVLYGAKAGLPNDETTEEQDEEAAWLAMLRAGWARPDPTFRRVFTQAFIPDATEEQMRWFDELQRMSTSVENILAARNARRGTVVTDLLGQIQAPTLVMHALHDTMTEFERGLDLAARIPNARLVPLDSRNHILLADEPAWRTFVDQLREFMREDAPEAERDELASRIDGLTPRELEIVRLAASGLDNSAIAGRLFLSVRTVERHLSNAYASLGVTGKAGRTAAAAALVRRDLS